MERRVLIVALGLNVVTLAGSGCIPTTTTPTPGDSFSSSLSLKLSSVGRAGYSGSIGSADDVDVFDIGPVEPGDRLVVTVTATGGSSLDPVAALFNADGELINYNDDRDYVAGDYSSFIDHTVRHASNHCYIAIADSGYNPSSGAYQLNVSVTRDNAVPVQEHQDVLLDFDGAVVSIPGDRTYVIPAFSAGSVDSRLRGQDASVEEDIRQVLEERYAGYDIDFYLSGDPNLPSSGEYSTLVFGGRSTDVFGIAQQVDHYNQDHTDKAIIFTNRWTDPFSTVPTTDAIITSIGNVAAHELGHLLGLEHTADASELMDASGYADTILVEQDFGVATLYEDVFPFGLQDALELLLDTLGTSSQ